MEIRQLMTFRMLARRLSFSRTASALNYAQSTVSAQIQALEDELGVVLFDRLGKHVRLTEAGQHLLSYAEKILDLTSEARASLSEGEALAGSLTLSIPETLCTYRLPPVLRRYRDFFPGVKLQVRAGPNVNLSRALSDGLMDLALIMAEPFQAPRCHVEALVREPLLVLAQPGHPLASQPAVRFADLQDEPLILTEPNCGYRKRFEQAARVSEGIAFPNAMEFHSVEAIKQCVAAGLGLTLLPAFAVADMLASGRLVALPLVGGPLAVITQMIWHAARWQPPAMRTFMSLVREHFGGLAEGSVIEPGVGEEGSPVSMALTTQQEIPGTIEAAWD